MPGEAAPQDIVDHIRKLTADLERIKREVRKVPTGQATPASTYYVGPEETTTPPVPDPNTYHLFGRDDGSGLTEVVAQFPSGSTRVLERDGGLGGGFENIQVPAAQASVVTGAVSGTTYLFNLNSVTTVGAANSAVCGFPFDPTHYAERGKLTKLRLILGIITNLVAPGVNFSASLVPITGIGGASGAAPTITAVGAALVTTTLLAPAAASAVRGYAETNAPAAGHYALALTLSGAQAAGSQVDVIPRLLVGAV